MASGGLYEGESIPLGRLERVPIRNAWPHEALNFTRWLAAADNLALLGDTLRLDLELVNVEVAVGAYKADVVARAGDETIVIENQFGKTDHDHLGKLLVYASGLKATMVIWIAETLTDEHRRALDWLNDNMSIHPAAVDNRDAWPEIFTWLRERAELFASTFKPRLDPLDLSSAASELAGGEADTLGAETAASDALG